MRRETDIVIDGVKVVVDDEAPISGSLIFTGKVGECAREVIIPPELEDKARRAHNQQFNERVSLQLRVWTLEAILDKTGVAY